MFFNQADMVEFWCNDNNASQASRSTHHVNV